MNILVRAHHPTLCAMVVQLHSTLTFLFSFSIFLTQKQQMMTMLIRLCKNSVASGWNLLVTSSHLTEHSHSVLYVMFVCVV